MADPKGQTASSVINMQMSAPTHIERARRRATHSCLVGGVDEEDEPPRLILRIESELRHIPHKDGTERLGNLEIVGRRVRRAAQVLEAELRDVRGRDRDPDRPAPDGELTIPDDLVSRVDGGTGGFEELFELGFMLRVDRVKVDTGELARPFPVVCAQTDRG